MIRALELWKLVYPKILGISVQEVHESRVAWPGFSIKRFAFHVSNIDVFCVSFLPLRVLQHKPIIEDEVSLLNFDMWINDRDKTALRLLHF